MIYLVVDVLFIKIRENGRVISKSVHVCIGISEEGTREIIGFLVQDGETQNTWMNFFEYLQKRSLKGVKLVISDAHQGLVCAIKESFPNCSWQRCQVHFMRNIFQKVLRKGTEYFRE